MARRGKSGPDEVPNDGTYEWTNKATGEKHTIPNGIDPGWAYNVGKAAWGHTTTAPPAGRINLGPHKSWSTEGRQERVPLDKIQTGPGEKLESQDEWAKAVESAIGGPEKLFQYGKPGAQVSVVAVAAKLAQHLGEKKEDRSAFVTMLPEVLSDPYEVWASFSESKATGKVSLRYQIIKGVDFGKGKGFLVVADAEGGVMQTITAYPMEARRMNAKRKGQLLYGR